MPESERLGTIRVITDTDTDMYEVGEVDGGFDRQRLRQHLECYGVTGVLKTLAHMTAMVVEEARDIALTTGNEHAQSEGRARE